MSLALRNSRCAALVDWKVIERRNVGRVRREAVVADDQCTQKPVSLFLLCPLKRRVSLATRLPWARTGCAHLEGTPFRGGFAGRVRAEGGHPWLLDALCSLEPPFQPPKSKPTKLFESIFNSKQIKKQLLTTDLLALTTMKNVANCDK